MGRAFPGGVRIADIRTQHYETTPNIAGRPFPGNRDAHERWTKGFTDKCQLFRAYTISRPCSVNQGATAVKQSHSSVTSPARYPVATTLTAPRSAPSSAIIRATI